MERPSFQNLSSNGKGKHLQPFPHIYQSQIPAKQNTLNLQQLLKVGRQHAVIVAGVTIAVASSFCLWSFNQQPEYESAFQLLVDWDTNETQRLFQVTQLSGDATGLNGNQGYETEIEVLRSPKLISPIIKALKVNYPDINSGSLIKRLKIKQIPKTQILEVTYRDTDPEKIKLVLETVAKGYLRYSWQQQQSKVNRGINFVEHQLPILSKRVNKLQQQLQIFRQKYNLLLPEITAEEISNRRNQIEEQQIATDIELNQSRTLYASIKRQLGTTEQAIASVSLTESPRYQGLLNKFTEAKTEQAIASVRFREDNPIIQQQKEQQQNLFPLLQKEAQNVLGTSLSKNTSTPESNSIHLALTQQLINTTNQIQTIQVRRSSLAQAKQNINQQIKQLSVISRQYTDLQRELEVATASLNNFLSVRESLQIESAQKFLPWELLLAPKQPEEPVSPNHQNNLILGSIAGLFLGICSALLLERLNNVFKSVEALRDSIQLPLLGLVPYQKQDTDLTQSMSTVTSQRDTTNKLESPAQKDKRTNSRSSPNWLSGYISSPFLEAFRSLNTNVRCISVDTPINSLVVSSTLAGEGKSTISVNLAKAAAAMGQRVLLVDADLRRPRIHELLGLPNRQGLSNVIASNVQPRSAIQPLSSWNNLHVLTAGYVPPDPTRLLSSDKMHKLMERFHAVYDLVIYDTPPTLGFADSKLLAAYTDGALMVVRIGSTDRSLFIQALNELTVSSTTILGLVANGVKGYADSLNGYYLK